MRSTSVNHWTETSVRLYEANVCLPDKKLLILYETHCRVKLTSGNDALLRTGKYLLSELWDKRPLTYSLLLPRLRFQTLLQFWYCWDQITCEYLARGEEQSFISTVRTSALTIFISITFLCLKSQYAAEIIFQMSANGNCMLHTFLGWYMNCSFL
jgi:hypothetical protein